MTPTEARGLDAEGIRKLWVHQYGDLPQKNKRKASFKLGDWVRVSRVKGVFEKGYEPSWSYAIYRVNGAAPFTYQLSDIKNEVVAGSWYEPELQHTIQNMDTPWPIEKVLRERTVNGVHQSFVKFMGYDNSYNRWVTM